MDDFSDIMNLPHHVSAKRRQMLLADRAAQFSAFAALTGYDEEINETARLTDTREAMSEDDIAELDASVYAARTATAARSICPPSPVTAHGQCPAENDSMCVYAGLVTDYFALWKASIRQRETGNGTRK